MIYRFEKNSNWKEFKIEDNLISMRDSQWPSIWSKGFLKWKPISCCNDITQIRERASSHGWKEITNSNDLYQEAIELIKLYEKEEFNKDSKKSESNNSSEKQPCNYNIKIIFQSGYRCGGK